MIPHQPEQAGALARWGGRRGGEGREGEQEGREGGMRDLCASPHAPSARESRTPAAQRMRKCARSAPHLLLMWRKQRPLSDGARCHLAHAQARTGIKAKGHASGKSCSPLYTEGSGLGWMRPGVPIPRTYSVPSSLNDDALTESSQGTRKPRCRS